MEGTRVPMEVKEVCVRQIFTKLNEIHSQYKFLEPGHGTNMKITFLVELHTNWYGRVPNTHQ
jgi:hypothetical protein